jgi:uncharacterized protein (TIGR00645 family)
MERTLNRLITQIGDIIYGIRWGLIPMYVGLWIAIVAYNVQFFREIIDFLFAWSPGAFLPHLRQNDSTHFLLWVLSLIDITMIANLVVMTTVGGYSTFVKEYDVKNLEGKPRWMNGLDSSSLKIKMGMSLIGVSAIHLLKTFMEAPIVSWDTILKEVLIHGFFIITTLAFTINARLQHSHVVTSSEPNETSDTKEHK